MPESILSSPIAVIIGIACLTICIFIHELGHFTTALWRKAKVPRFSIFGLGSPIFSRKWRGVEWCVCWIPFGAYVQVPQLADLGELEGGDAAEYAHLPPLGYWDRFIVAVGGPAFNLILAFVLASVLWLVGQEMDASAATTRIGYVSSTITLSDGREVPSPAAQAGLQVGDIIRSIDGHRTKDWQDVLDNIVFGAGSADGQRQSEFVVERGGQLVSLTLHPQLATEEKTRRIGIAAYGEYKVYSVDAGSTGEKLGLLAGDRIAAVDGRPIISGIGLSEALRANADHPITLRVLRGDTPVEIPVAAGTIMASAKGFGVLFTTDTTMVYLNPFGQIGTAIARTFRMLWSLVNPFSDIRLSQMGSVIGIVDGLKQAAQAGWRIVLLYMVLINVGLAVLNLLPIPVLDGGHILFATIGKLRGRALNPELIARIQFTFFVLLISMMLYVSFHDVRRIRRENADETEQQEPEKKPETAPENAPAAEEAAPAQP